MPPRRLDPDRLRTAQGPVAVAHLVGAAVAHRGLDGREDGIEIVFMGCPRARGLERAVETARGQIVDGFEVAGPGERLAVDLPAPDADLARAERCFCFFAQRKEEIIVLSAASGLRHASIPPKAPSVPSTPARKSLQRKQAAPKGAAVRIKRMRDQMEGALRLFHPLQRLR